MTLEKELKRKKENLKYFYQMAQEALDAKDLEHAIKISAKGLEENESENEEEWADEFDAIHSTLEPTQEIYSLNTTITQEDLTIIKGVGVAVAKKLKTAGFDSVKAIAESNLAQLISIQGIGQKTAQKILEGAQTIFSRKSLNDFHNESQSENTPTPAIGDENKDVKTSEESSNRKSSIPWFEDKFKVNRLSHSKVRKVEYEEVDDSSDIIEVDTDFIHLTPVQHPQETINVPNSSHLLSELITERTPQHTYEALEELTPSEKNSVIERVVRVLQEKEFHIVEKVQLLKELSMNSDLIAIKIIHANEFLDLVLILPIKLSGLKGQIKMSNEQIKYVPLNEKFNENGSSFRLLLDSTISDLGGVYETMQNDLINQGKLLSYIRSHLQVDISIEKSFTKKKLFFRASSLQYKVFIEPTLLCNNEVRFLEKTVPFPYLKDINLHIIHGQKFSDLLIFLEQKYQLIEEQREEKSLLISYEDSFNQFLQNGKKFSLPFMGFGAILLALVLVQSFSFLEFIVNIGYALLGIYVTSLSYLYIRFFKVKLAIQTDFNTPYHLQQVIIDDAGLKLIKEELSASLMRQFIYECFGKNSESKFISTVEESYTKEKLEKVIRSPQIHPEEIFEEIEDEKPDDEIFDKYSAFLED
ncbi:MAG: helix-hairpin-helix domain-containing protein [Promethearchaeota archaeon]